MKEKEQIEEEDTGKRRRGQERRRESRVYKDNETKRRSEDCVGQTFYVFLINNLINFIIWFSHLTNCNFDNKRNERKIRRTHSVLFRTHRGKTKIKGYLALKPSKRGSNLVKIKHTLSRISFSLQWWLYDTEEKVGFDNKYCANSLENQISSPCSNNMIRHSLNYFSAFGLINDLLIASDAFLHNVH